MTKKLYVHMEPVGAPILVLDTSLPNGKIYEHPQKAALEREYIFVAGQNTNERKYAGYYENQPGGGTKFYVQPFEVVSQSWNKHDYFESNLIRFPNLNAAGNGLINGVFNGSHVRWDSVEVPDDYFIPPELNNGDGNDYKPPSTALPPQPGDPGFVGPVQPQPTPTPQPNQPIATDPPKPGDPNFVGPVQPTPPKPGDPNFVGPVKPAEPNPQPNQPIATDPPKPGDPNFVGPLPQTQVVDAQGRPVQIPADAAKLGPLGAASNTPQEEGKFTDWMYKVFIDKLLKDYGNDQIEVTWKFVKNVISLEDVWVKSFDVGTKIRELADRHDKGLNTTDASRKLVGDIGAIAGTIASEKYDAVIATKPNRVPGVIDVAKDTPGLVETIFRKAAEGTYTVSEWLLPGNKIISGTASAITHTVDGAIAVGLSIYSTAQTWNALRGTPPASLKPSSDPVLHKLDVPNPTYQQDNAQGPLGFIMGPNGTLMSNSNTKPLVLAATSVTGTNYSDVFIAPTYAGSWTANGGGGNDTIAAVGTMLKEANLSSTPGQLGHFTMKFTGSEVKAANIAQVDFLDGSMVYGQETSGAAVHRLYQAGLDRNPDGGGISSWTHALDHGASLKQLAAGFLNSAEFKARFSAAASPDHGAFVEQMYQNVLHRGPDATGKAHWLNALNSRSLDRADVLVEFSNSPENKGNTSAEVAKGVWVPGHEASQVARLYDTVLARRPDKGGLESWEASLKTGEITLKGMADQFTASPEFQSKYGAVDNTAFVNLLYNNVLHRPADAAGRDHWLNQMTNGMSRSDVVLSFSESAEHQINTSANIDNGILIA